MRKIIILGACILAALNANAQLSVVNEAERAMNSDKTAKEVADIMQPAFTNPETAKLARTWFIPGKAAFKQYDDLLALSVFGNLPEGGALLMANLLIDGYKYFTTALPLDSLPNENGKIKPKYSKDIHNTIANFYYEYDDAAMTFWQAKDFDKAYDAWELFCTIPDKFEVKAPSDSTLGERRYNQALAAWQIDKCEDALNAFLKAKDLGYNKKNLYDYAIAVAMQAKNDDAVFNLAKEAQALYGKEDPNYVSYIITRYQQNKEFDKAFTIIDDAIATHPDNAPFYVMKGILLSQTGKKTESKEFFKKAISLDEYYSMALFQYGFALYEEADTLYWESPIDDESIFNEKVVPLFLEAADYLERAYNVDNENTDALHMLKYIYDFLHDEKNLEDVQNRLK